MQPTTQDDWPRWRQQGFKRLPAALVRQDESPPSSWEGFADGPVSALLESTRGGRYTYLCDRPERVVLANTASAEVRSADGLTRLGERAGSPLVVLAALLSEANAPTLPEWTTMAGGFIGVASYDLVRTWERLPAQATRDLPLPLLAMVETRELFVYDHEERTLGIVIWRNVEAASPADLAAQYQEALQAAHDAWARWKAGGGRAAHRPERVLADPVSAPADSFTAAGFQQAVRHVQEYIAAGHTYQTNLSVRSSRVTRVPSETLYEAVRRVNPSPYMGLLRLPAFALVCGSPELLVRLVNGRIVSRPIAGTRPRDDDAARDLNLSAELFANEKERAEHLMLVDLIRNDIGRVAEWGTVAVREFMAVERYSHVMHLVSEVEGRLAPGKTWVDLLQSMFPGGTITGCPKLRTMEIIEELEPVGRGFYTGSLGWIGYGGNMEMNIVIRSMLVSGGVAHVQAGAGIVADSRPEREYAEATQKARALWVAWEMAAKNG
ncbi:MAG: hypothetical protein RIQ93_703 [Verrucomicrobiota bacterium]|jgi:para-aminobenzoate synthetase component 1